MALTRQTGLPAGSISLPALSPHVADGENWTSGEDGDHDDAKDPAVFEDIARSRLVSALDTEIDHEIHRHYPSDHQTPETSHHQVHQPPTEVTVRHSAQPSLPPFFTTSTSQEAR